MGKLAVLRERSTIPEIPPLSSHAGYAAASKRLQELGEHLTQLESDIEEKRREYSETVNPAVRALDDAAQRMIDGEVIEAVDSEALQAALSSDIQRLITEREITRRAVQLQRRKVEELEYVASKEICDGLAEDNRELVRGIALALIELGKAYAPYIEFQEAITNQRIYASTLRLMNFRGINAADRYSSLRSWLREAVEYGFLDPSELPWRD